MTKTKDRTNITTYTRCGYTFSLVCDICGYQAYNSNGLGIHLRNSHDLSYIEYLRKIKHPFTNKRICEYCGKEFELSNKQLIKELKRNYSAKGCSKKCNSRLTCKTRYGNEKYRNQEKAKITCLEKYGVENCFQSKEKQEKAKKTCNLKYNTDYYHQSEEGRKKSSIISASEEVQTKKYLTQKKNNSFNGKGIINNTKCSSEEQFIYEKLIMKYPNTEYNKYIKGYGKCDFYIPELDLYIEYQGFWTHNNHAFDINSINDTNELKVLEKLAKKSEFYKDKLRVWYISDPKRRTIAKEKNLNWLEFFTLNEFINWYMEN